MSLENGWRGAVRKTIAIEPELDTQLRDLADEYAISMNKLIIIAIESYVANAPSADEIRARMAR